MAITDNRTAVCVAQTSTPASETWVATSSASEDTDVYIEGTTSIGEQLTDSRRYIMYDAGSAQNWSDNVFYIWINCGIVGLLESVVNDGFCIRFAGATVTDYFERTVGGNDSWPTAVEGGWVMFVIDIEEASANADLTGGTPPATSAIRYVGFSGITTSKPKNTDNTWIDAVWRLPKGNPGIIVTGTANDWDDVVTTAEAGSWGTAKYGPGGSIVLNTPIRFGANDANADSFSDTNRTILWEDWNLDDDFYVLNVIAGTGTQSFSAGTKTGTGNDATGSQGWTISSATTGPRWRIDAGQTIEFYADASDAGPTDTGNFFTNDANVFDGNPGTSASGTSSGASVALDLTGEGTNASGWTGTEVTAVYWRVFATSANEEDRYRIREDTVTTGRLLGEKIPTNNTLSEWELLQPPKGGWTLAKAQALVFEYYGASSLGAASATLNAVQFRAVANTNIDGLDLYGCSFQHGEFFTLHGSVVETISCVFNDCRTITPHSSVFLRNTLLNLADPEGQYDPSAPLVSVDDITTVKYCAFSESSQLTQNHAVWIEEPDTPQTCLQNTFTSYGADDTATAALRYLSPINAGADAITVNVTGGSGVNTTVYDTGTDGVTLVVDPVDLTIHVTDAATGGNVSGARVLVYVTSGVNWPYLDSVTITRSGTTASVSHTAHGLSNGDKVLISGADQEDYNIIATISNVSTNAYDYTVANSPTTPATGTITSTFVLIDGTTDVNGEITDNRTYGVAQPIGGRVRRGSTSPLYKTGAISGTVSNTAGLDLNIQLIRDE